MGRTLARLLAIVGLGFLLGVGHSVARTTLMGKRGLVLTLQTQDGTQPVETPSHPAPTPGGQLPPAGTEPTSDADPLDAPVNSGHITLREAKRLFDEGAYFLDARHLEDFEAGHIEGAVSMPASRVLTRDGIDALDAIPPESTVVVYCTGGDCDASENTVINIQASAYTLKLVILGKGYDDWAAAGLPTESGEPTP